MLYHPAAAAVIKEEVLVGAGRLQFDGGCRELGGRKQGAGGFITWDTGGRCLRGEGRFYGS